MLAVVGWLAFIALSVWLILQGVGANILSLGFTGRPSFYGLVVGAVGVVSLIAIISIAPFSISFNINN